VNVKGLKCYIDQSADKCCDCERADSEMSH